MGELPNAFYKYQSRAAGRAVLTGRTLRWSTPATLNDPFDIQFDLGTTVDEDKVCNLALAKLWAAYKGQIEAPIADGNMLGLAITLLRLTTPNLSKPEFLQEMEPALREGLINGNRLIPQTLAKSRELMATSKILCLTDSATNHLMWSHYAEAHQGLALILAPTQSSPYTLAREVQYVEEVPALFDDDTLSDILAGLALIDIRSTLDKLIYTKSLHWSYEREWRVFAGDGRDKYAPYEDVPFGWQELTGIVLGARMSATEKAAFAALARAVNPNALAYEAKLTSQFGVSISLASI